MNKTNPRLDETLVEPKNPAPWETRDFDAEIFPGSGVMFTHSRWQLPNHNPAAKNCTRCIKWEVEFPERKKLTDPEYSELLWTAKCFIWALIHPRGLRSHARSGTVITEWHWLKTLLRWMIANSYWSFADLNRSAIEDYIGHILQKPTKRSHKANELSVLVHLFDSRGRLPPQYSLKFHPFGGLTAGHVVGFRNSQKVKIPPIPDEIILPVINEANRWLTDYADDILRLAEAVENDRKDTINRKIRNVREHLRPVVLNFKFSAAAASNPRFANIRTVDDVKILERDLITAASIAIMLMVGPRISELFSFKIGCIRGPVLTDDQTLEIFYIRGRTQKRSLSATGHEREWVAAARSAGSTEQPIVLRAVEVAEKLATILGCTAKKIVFSPRSRMVPSRTDWSIFVEKFAASILQIKWRPKTHSFRKTYAKFVARHDPTNLSAVAQQFGHVNLAHTMSYVGEDSELNELVDDAIAEEISHALLDLVRAPALAGKTGEQLTPVLARLRATIVHEAEFVTIVRRLTMDSEIQIHVGPWGVCYFRAKNNPRCLGTRGPNFMIRSAEVCMGCDNFCASSQHVAYHEWRIGEYIRMVDVYPDAPSILKDDWNQRIASSKQVLQSLNSTVLGSN